MNVSIELVPRDWQTLEEELCAVTKHFPNVTTVNIPDLTRFEVRSWQACAFAKRYVPRALPHLRAADIDLGKSLAVAPCLESHHLNEVLIIKGDATKGEARDSHPSSTVEVITRFREELPDVQVYAAIDPYRQDFRGELEYAQEKLEAGAVGFFTQPFFDVRLMEVYAELLPDVPVYWGVTSVTSKSSVGYWKKRNNAVFPASFEPTMAWCQGFAREALTFAKERDTNLYFMPIRESAVEFLGGRAVSDIKSFLKERILVLDGAMGSLIQDYKLDEAGFRGERFEDHALALQGANDVLCLTQPQIISEIHRAYLEAGADIISTNTFNATSIGLSEYGLKGAIYDLNVAAARLAREAADAIGTPDKPRFVAGALGPTNRTASLSPDVTDPGFRATSFDELAESYAEQVRGLLEGGADIILIETVFDTLNAKAALFGADTVFEAAGKRLPVMISGTITDASGRTLSGQTLEAFLISVSHADLLTVGLNCALGPEELRAYVEELSGLTEHFTHAYPNAGLPNAFGGYDETPESMMAVMEEWLSNGWVNILGGCCGTTPEHIKLFAEVAAKYPPRVPPEVSDYPRFSGLEPLVIRPDTNFVNVGERTNITGSRKFARLILNDDYDEALSVARNQVEGGAQMIDVNMDEGMLDGKAAMVTFLNLIASEPDIAKLPIMLDSSKFEILEAGLKCVQGKGVVNSISLKEGEETFKKQARLVKRYGAAVIVMAFDEQGQADTFERRTEVCERAYRILTDEVGFAPHDIIFDPNILTVATGIEEHNDYAVAFIEATRWIKENLPGALVSGGLSNISFSFRGNNRVREAMHAAFLYHAIEAGLDMGIVNPGMLEVYEEIPKDVLEHVEDVLLNRRPDATERLVTLAETVKGGGKKQEKTNAGATQTSTNA